MIITKSFLFLGFFKKHDLVGELTSTGTDMNTLVDIGTKFSTPPDDFNLHPGNTVTDSAMGVLITENDYLTVSNNTT